VADGFPWKKLYLQNNCKLLKKPNIHKTQSLFLIMTKFNLVQNFAPYFSDRTLRNFLSSSTTGPSGLFHWIL
jgi:hypothetical protein